MPYIGEFEIDPELIPDAAVVPENTNITLEIVASERKVTEKEGGGSSVRIAIRVQAPDFPGANSAFASLWVTEQYKGEAHRSLAKFLHTMKLPYTTQAAELVHLRFTGQVRKNAKNPDFLDVSKVVGPVS